MQPDLSRFPIGTKVRFTSERLSVLMPPDRRRLEGRVGTVQGHWRGTKNPVVYFPEIGLLPELRLLKVDPRHLERVEASPPPTEEGGGNMSQSELDNLFG